MSVQLNNRVAIVTGAGGGLGRAHALALAAAGAQVVVNDPGARLDGEGVDASAADAVVDEIRAAGGEAVPSYESVADPGGADRIIATATTRFGRLDILVNNAGILRDKTLLKLTDEMWRAVLAVHLDGTLYCGRAAAHAMRAAGRGGRIINTTSISGLLGNFGQSNYAAAKAGIAGLTRVWAKELASHRITVNAIAPLARTRMTESLGGVPTDLRPEQVSQLVVFLASPLAAHVSGRILGAHGRHLFEYRVVRSDGVTGDADWTPESIAAQFEALLLPDPQPDDVDLGGSGEHDLTGAIAAIEAAYDPGRAGDWRTALHLVVAELGTIGVTVGEGRVRVDADPAGQARTTVETDRVTFAALLAGRIQGQQAYMEGKLTTDHLPDLMRFGQVFRF